MVHIKDNIFIFGTSGFSREVGDIALEIGYTPIYVARDENEANIFSGEGEVITEDSVKKYRKYPFSIGIGDNEIRKNIFIRYQTTLRFVGLVHPSATFGLRQLERIDNSRGIIICAGVRLTNTIKVGDFCIFNLNCTIGHDAVIEDFVNVAPGVSVSGHVHIEAGCWIGSGAVINQGVADKNMYIRHNTVIGSGSVIARDCEPNSVYWGVPARKIK